MEERDWGELKKMIEIERMKTRDRLYRNLYIAARAAIHPMYQNNPTAVNFFIDNMTKTYYKKSLDEMLNWQIMEMIDDLNQIGAKNQ